MATSADWTLPTIKAAWREAEAVWSKVTASPKLIVKHVEKLRGAVEWARVRCGARVSESLELPAQGQTGKGEEDLASARARSDLETALFIANDICPKLIDNIFKYYPGDGEEARAEDTQAALRSCIALIVRLSYHPHLTRGLDSLARILLTAKPFYKRNGSLHVEDSEVDEDEQEDVDLDDLAEDPDSIEDDLDPENDAMDTEDQSPEEQQRQQARLMARNRRERHRKALDPQFMVVDSNLSHLYFGVKELAKELKRERREDRRRRKAQREAQQSLDASGISIGRSSTPASMGEASVSSLSSSTATSGAGNGIEDSRPSTDVQDPSSTEEAPTTTEAYNLDDEDPSANVVDGRAICRRLRRRVRSDGESDLEEDEEDEEDEELDDDEDDDDNVRYEFLDINDDHNRLFHEGFLAKKSFTKFSVYVRKTANYIIRSGCFSILYRRLLKTATVPGVGYGLPDTVANPAPNPLVYPFFTTNQTSFLNWTGSFKVICRLFPFLHPSIVLQCVGPVTAAFRNVFLPLSCHVEGVRQDVFNKEMDEVFKVADAKLLVPAQTNAAYLPSNVAFVGLPNKPKGQTLDTYRSAWDMAASQEPIFTIPLLSRDISSEQTTPGGPTPSPTLSIFPPMTPAVYLATPERTNEDFAAEWNLIRVMASLDSRILERRLWAMNMLLDISKEGAHLIEHERERKRLISQYHLQYTEWQKNYEEYKRELASRQELEMASQDPTASGAGQLPAHVSRTHPLSRGPLPLVPPRKPEHPFMLYPQYQQQSESHSPAHLPVHYHMPVFLKHHAPTLLNALFGAKVHVALLPKARELLVFFAQHNFLTTWHLDFIWQSQLSKHISIVHLVWDALNAVVEVLPFDLLEHLFLLIQRDLTPQMISKECIHLIRAVTVAAIHRQDQAIHEEIEQLQEQHQAKRSTRMAVDQPESGNQEDDEASKDSNSEDAALADTISGILQRPRKLYGLWTFLLFLSDGSALAAQSTMLIREVVEALRFILDGATGQSLRLPFLVHCVERFRANQSIAQAALLFSTILDTFVPFKTAQGLSDVVAADFPSIPPPTLVNQANLTSEDVSTIPTTLVTTDLLTRGNSIPVMQQQITVIEVINWLERNYSVQSTVIFALKSYKSLVFAQEASISNLSDSSFGNAIPSKFVIESQNDKATEARRNEGWSLKSQQAKSGSPNLASPVALHPSSTSSGTNSAPSPSTSPAVPQGNNAAGSSKSGRKKKISFLPNSPFTYIEHINIRMRLMITVAHNCTIKQLTGEALEEWYSLLSKWCFTRREMQLIFEHLTLFLFNYATSNFPVAEADLHLLFDKLQTDLDVKEIGTSELDTLKAFVVYFAWRANQYVPIAQRDPAFPHGFCICGDINNLIGLPFIWRIAVEAKDEKAAEAAANILVSFYEYPHPNMDKFSFQTAFVKNAIQVLEESYKVLIATGSDSSHVIRISRCLALIRKVLSSGVNRAAPTTRGAAIKLTLKNLQNASTDISVFHNDPVSVIRAKAAEFLKVPPSEVRLIMQGKELKAEVSDATPISQMTPTISPGATIHILKKPTGSVSAAASPTEPTQAAPEAIPAIAALLSSEPYFSLFFNLLLLASKNDDTKQAHEVWSLLMDLPHNKDLIQGLQSIAQSSPSSMEVDSASPTVVNWSVLLDPSNAYKLFYSLQIVESLIRPREGATKTSQEWCEAFRATGGVRHLVWLLLKAPLTDHAQGFKRFPSATLILDILSHFVLIKDSAASSATTPAGSLPTSPSTVVAPAHSPALTSLFEDELLISSVLNQTTAKDTSHADAVGQLRCMFAQRLLELGHASVAQEPSNFSSTAHLSQTASAASATPSTQENQDADANAAAVAPTSALPAPVIASTSDLLFAQIWPFVLALASHSPDSMTSSIISKDMEVRWKLLVQVVMLGSCNLDIVRMSLLSAITAIISVTNEPEYLLSSDEQTDKPRSKALLFFTIVALDAFSAVSPPSGLPYSNEFFLLLSSCIANLYGGRVATLETHPAIVQISGRLHDLVATFALVLRNYPVIERRGEATRDVFLMGCLETMRMILVCFPNWICEHPSIISGGAIPQLADNPLEEAKKQENQSEKNEEYTLVTSVANLLFRMPSPSNSGPAAPPACKTADSRSAAFGLLLKLVDVDSYVAGEAEAKDSPAQLVRLKHLACLLNHFIQPRHIGRSSIGGGVRSWAYQPMSMEKASCGYVGLRNLAATCYMNSLMQQFYMVPQFRARIFSLNPFPEEVVDAGIKAAKPDALVDSRNVLFQLQNMFAHLQESQQKYYDPTSFTKVYKGPDGRVMNPIVQMDAEEFFAGLLDKIESVIKGTPDEKAVREFFGGTLCQQVEAKDCGHVSKREEDMLTIPVEVKGKSNLYESLAAFVKADILDGDNKYQCSQCNQMVDARKFACLGKLPDNLVFSLKRFDFDFERLMRVKVNDYFEFPTTLSVEPYTEEGLKRKAKREAEEAAQAAAAAAAKDTSAAPTGDTAVEKMDVTEGEIKLEVPGSDDSYDPADYEYELSGIVIHRGTADSGHYYSYIKDRNSGGSDGSKAKWYLFNDMSVESFEEGWIPQLAFGGEDETRRSYKTYSAYMLFYTKIRPVHAHVQAKIDEKALSASVPEHLFANTWVDNASFLLDQQIYEKPYLEFLESLVKKGDILTKVKEVEENSKAPPQSEALSLLQQTSVVALTKLNITLITETLLQMRIKTHLANHMSVLADMVSWSPVAAKTLLSCLASGTDRASHSVSKLFVDCPTQDIKTQFANIVGFALISVLRSINSDDEVDFSLLGSDSLTALLPEQGEDGPAFGAHYRDHARHFIDVWMNLICDYSKLNVSTEERRDMVTSAIKCLAQVLSVALEDKESRSTMVEFMMPYLHLIMEILEKMPGPEDEEQRKKLKDWRSAFKPLVSIIASVVTSSTRNHGVMPFQLLDMTSDTTSSPPPSQSLLKEYDDQAIALLPEPLHFIGDIEDSKPKLTREAWAILSSDSFLSLILADAGLAANFNQNTVNICNFLIESHPAWARHILALCVGLMKEVSYDRYENLVALIPAVLAHFRHLRQAAWDDCYEVRTRLMAKLSSMDANSDGRKVLDSEWAWLLFPGGFIDSTQVNFAEEYLSKIYDDSDGIAYEREGELTIILTPHLNLERLRALASLIDEPEQSGSSSSMEVDRWSVFGTKGVVERLRSLSRASLLHSHTTHWLTHKALPLVLETKKALKFASYWTLRLLLDCVDSDFAVRGHIAFGASPSPILDDWFHHHILFEKCERVRSIAERLYQSTMIGNDARRRIWNSASDELILDRLASSSQLNSYLSPVATPLLPRRYLPEPIEPLWEENNMKNATEIILSNTGVLSLPATSQCADVQTAINLDLLQIHKSIAEEVAEEQHKREKPLVLAEDLDFVSTVTNALTIQSTSIALMEKLYRTLINILKTITKGDVTCVDAARQEKTANFAWIFKYRMVQPLRLMTWLLMRLPQERRLALQRKTFEECWSNIWMLWKEGVGDPFDHGRTALYGLVDILSHEFPPILHALAKETSFMHMNIHVNAEKAVGAFNDRTSGHFFRIIMRTMIQLDLDKRAQIKPEIPASIFDTVSQPRSVLDIALIQKKESGEVSEDSDALNDSELIGKLTTMPAWDWALNWLFIRGFERYPTLCLYLEQLVRMWTKRFPRRDHLVSTTVSIMEQFPQFAAIDKFGGAPRLFLIAILGSLQPEFYLHPQVEDTSPSWSSMPGLNLEMSIEEISAFSGPFPPVVSQNGHHALINPADASTSHINPFKDGTRAMGVTDWNGKYPSILPISPLATLELPSKSILHEGLASWVSDVWVLIEQRLVAVSMNMIFGNAGVQFPSLLSGLIAHPTSPTPAHRALYDILITLRLALSWILPYQWIQQGRSAVPAEFESSSTGSHHRPLAPLQVALFNVMRSDETLTRSAEVVIMSLSQLQLSTGDKLVSGLCSSILVRDTRLDYSRSEESIALRESLVSLAIDLIESVSALRPSALDIAVNNLTQSPHSNFSFFQGIPAASDAAVDLHTINTSETSLKLSQAATIVSLARIPNGLAESALRTAQLNLAVIISLLKTLGLRDANITEQSGLQKDLTPPDNTSSTALLLAAIATPLISNTSSEDPEIVSERLAILKAQAQAAQLQHFISQLSNNAELAAQLQSALKHLL